MTKKVKIILSVVLLVALALLLLHFLREEPVAKEVKFKETVSIKNKDTSSYYDTIVQAGLQVLEIDTAYISIRPMIYQIESSGHDSGDEVKAALVAGPKGSNQYIIYVSDLSKYEAVRWIAHELVHLEQYHSGRLKYVAGHAIYEGRNYGFPEAIRYEDRPWEAEAIHRSRILERSINHLLYLDPEDEGIRQDYDRFGE